MNTDQFWDSIDKSAGSKGCWIWKRGRFQAGYGAANLNGADGYAHRFAWQLRKGAIPLGILVCHSCDNPPCCNPAHLFLGTDADNLRDMRSKGRWRRKAPASIFGERHPNHRLSSRAVRFILSRVTVGVTGPCSQSALARRFGVTKNSIMKIVRGQAWRHIPRPNP